MILIYSKEIAKFLECLAEYRRLKRHLLCPWDPLSRVGGGKLSVDDLGEMRVPLGRMKQAKKLAQRTYSGLRGSSLIACLVPRHSRGGTGS